MERSRDEAEVYSLTEPLNHRARFSFDLDPESEPEGEETIAYPAPPLSAAHIASIEERKRLWWRNALINLLFIGSWCVAGHLCAWALGLTRVSGSVLQHCYPCITNGCSRPNTMDSRRLFLSQPCICLCSSRSPRCSAIFGPSASSLRMIPPLRNMGKHVVNPTPWCQMCA